MRLRRSRSLAVTAGVALALATTPALAASGASAAPAAWAATATQGLRPASARDLGALPATSRLTVDVTLGIRNRAALASLIQAEATPGNAHYRHFLTPRTFDARFAPTASQVAAVRSYLSRHGFDALRVTGNRLEVVATGTAADAESAFHTTLRQFLRNGLRLFANTTPASVPASLASTVTAVVGLNDLDGVVAKVDTAPTSVLGSALHDVLGLAGESTFSPPQLATAYDVGTVPPARGISIAIMADGDLTGVVSDLRAEEAADGETAVPVTIVPTGVASTDTSGTDEWDLDSQVSTGVAGTVSRLYLYDAPSLDDSAIVTEIGDFASQDVAQAGSASFGECELDADMDGTITAVDEDLMDAASQGQTFFAATGDTGAACPVVSGTNGIPDGGLPATVDYPASSTYATAVGGTTLLTAGGDYSSELAWDAGGGGVSLFEAPGPWTANANPLYPVLSPLKRGRGVPDIAMDADPSTGANITVAGKMETVGGTSLSSPLALGAWARVDNTDGGHLGDAALAFYRLYNATNPSILSRKATPGFHDIILGTNGLFVATPGWDFTTGIGSIDIAALTAALK